MATTKRARLASHLGLPRSKSTSDANQHDDESSNDEFHDAPSHTAGLPGHMGAAIGGFASIALVQTAPDSISASIIGVPYASVTAAEHPYNLPPPAYKEKAPVLPPTKTPTLWEIAYSRLPQNYNEVFGRASSFREVIKTATDARDKSKKEAWTVIVGEHEYIVRDVLDKILNWMDRMAKIGDILASYDPQHMAIPWAAFRLCLECAMADGSNRLYIVVGLERVANVMVRCAIYEVQFEKEALPKENLIKLYQKILSFLAQAVEWYDKHTLLRVVAAIFDAQIMKDALDSIENINKEVQEDAAALTSKLTLNTMNELNALIESLDERIVQIDSSVALLAKHSVEEKRNKILAWISQIEYLKHYQQHAKSITPGTCEWFTKTTIYRNWLQSSFPSIMWLRGDPGFGKTTLTTMVIKQMLESRITTQSDEAIAYFYCNRSESARRDIDYIMATLLKQLSIYKGSLLAPVVEEYGEREENGFASGSLSCDESTKLIIGLCNTWPQTTIIIDALDECAEETREQLVDLLRDIHDSGNLVKIFVSSRDLDKIGVLLDDVPSYLITMSDNRADIDLHIDLELKRCIDKHLILRGHVSDDLGDLIATTLKANAGGMFQWAVLQVQQLCRHQIESSLRSSLQCLPIGLEDTYEMIWQSILHDQPDRDVELALITLKLLMGTLSDASVEMLSESISWYLPNKSKPELYQILAVCYNLIVYNPTTDGVRYAHLSVRDFLAKKITEEVSALLIAKGCIKIMSVDNLTKEQFFPKPLNRCQTLQKWNRSRHNTAYIPKENVASPLDYASRWGMIRAEVAQGALDAEFADDLATFLGTHEKPGHFFKRWMLYRGTRELVSEDLSPFLTAACFGFADYISRFDEIPFRLKSVEGDTILGLASKCGSSDVLKLMLQRGKHIYTARDYSECLIVACAYGPVSAVALLVDVGAEMEFQCSKYSATIKAASGLGECMLLQKISDLEDGLVPITALMLASGSDKDAYEKVKKLIARGNNPNVQGALDITALGEAIRLQNRQVIEHLLSAGADTTILRPEEQRHLKQIREVSSNGTSIHRSQPVKRYERAQRTGYQKTVST